MISFYQRRHPGGAAGAAGPDPDRDDAQARHDAEKERVEAHLTALYRVGQDAARHGYDLARIRVWRMRDALAAGLGKLFLVLLLSVAAIGVATTIAVWGTVHVLGGLAAVAGGGLLGSLLALLIVLGALVLLGSVIRYRRKQARADSLRRRLGQRTDGAVGEDAPRERDELEEMQQQAVARLKADKDRALDVGARVVREYPVATLGVSAASGAVVSRLLRGSPRAVRRATVAAVRAGRVIGLGGLASAAKQAMAGGGERDAS